jgi:hypothetical protein
LTENDVCDLSHFKAASQIDGTTWGTPRIGSARGSTYSSTRRESPPILGEYLCGNKRETSSLVRCILGRVLLLERGRLFSHGSSLQTQPSTIIGRSDNSDEMRDAEEPGNEVSDDGPMGWMADSRWGPAADQLIRFFLVCSRMASPAPFCLSDPPSPKAGLGRVQDYRAYRVTLAEQERQDGCSNQSRNKLGCTHGARELPTLPKCTWPFKA